MSNDVNFKEGSFFDSDPELQSCQIMLFFFKSLCFFSPFKDKLILGVC